MKINTKDQVARREKSRAAMEKWLDIREKQLKRTAITMEQLDHGTAITTLLLDIAHSLRMISYGHVLDGRAKAARDKQRKNFNVNNKYKKNYESKSWNDERGI